MSFFNLSVFRSEVFVVAIKFLLNTAIIWLPIFLGISFLIIWIRYRRLDYIIKQGGVLLELKLPKEVTKSPAAMELVFTALWQTGSSDYLKTFLEGKMRPWFSLELVSLEGQVHFYIWTQLKWRSLVESQIYSQYPGVEIVEVDDYTKNVFNDRVNHELWATNFFLAEPDVYPIKTYIDYGLDKEQEEEYKIDPMTSVLEFLGSVPRNNQVWIQILIQAHREDTMKDDAVLFKKHDWREEAKEVIHEKLAELKVVDDEEGEGVRSRTMTPGEKETIAALERSQSKHPFEVGIRGFYIFRPDAFDSIYISGLIGSFRQYNSLNLNRFKIGHAFTDFDYPWQDFRRIRRTHREHEMLNAYKLRSFFQNPYKHVLVKPFILNTEELATIFHLPGMVASTPTLPKTPSKKGQAPPNLPV